MFIIEKGIEIPIRTDSRNKYPFRDMEIGDSFFVPNDNLPPSASKNFCQFVQPGAKRLGIKITTRKVKDGFRVWRIE